MSLPKVHNYAIHSSLKNGPIISEVINQCSPEYAYVRLKEDNDYLFSGCPHIITEVDCLDEFDTFLNYHRQAIGDFPWALLMTPKTIRQGESSLVESFVINEYASQYGIANPDLSDLEAWKEIFGEYPSIVSLKISPPVVFPKEVIDFCEENNILIVATDITLGNFAFSLDYLYRVACKYANIVCIEVSSLEDSICWSSLINHLHGREFDEETDSVLILNKDIPYNDALVPKKLDKIDKFLHINGDTWKVEGDLVFPGLIDITLSITSLENINLENISEIEKSILDKCKDPLPGNMEIGEIRYLLRNQVSNLLRSELKKYTHFGKFELLPVSDNICIVTLSRKIFRFFKVTRSFLLNISSGPVMYFKEIPQKEFEKD